MTRFNRNRQSGTKPRNQEPDHPSILSREDGNNVKKGSMGKFQQVVSRHSRRYGVRRFLLSAVLGLGMTLSLGTVSYAQFPDNTPAPLKTTLQGLERTANAHDLDALQDYYGAEFSTGDNVPRPQYFETLAQLWEDYPNLNYYTELESWQQTGDRLTAETVTYITGTREANGREIRLKSTVRSRQVLANNQIIRQEILSEQTQLLMGDNPPEVSVNLPDAVQLGETFNFDVIVQEPLGNDLLLGGAIQETVNGDRYLTPSDFELELLQAGGIFKQGRVEEDPSDRWLSAVLIREDGILIVTQRLRIEE
ncbi:nuclear transport factor 2 family protein [Spirulina sp. CS-785/01]|uniref:nuclear transport factor 2 family protein n=1 Tax=Spirulina sp. CS-785/01 TaxID=3021716 RepID=UPI00232C8FDE|nr:nuclear transport factor 2 family protein [Spirulina sp. CS-785/01]MDB9314149.1 nuclear transport factor 2 family protein [Spirulina sp. CS-785/01]